MTEALNNMRVRNGETFWPGMIKHSRQETGSSKVRKRIKQNELYTVNDTTAIIILHMKEIKMSLKLNTVLGLQCTEY